MLGKTQKSKNADWLWTLKNIESLASKEKLFKLVEQTALDIRRTVGSRRAAFSWSGGKDSVVLAYLCRLAGITECVLAVTGLEYPAFLRWAEKNNPPGLEIINTGQNLEWLKKNQPMLFPRDSATAARWYQIVQHRGQTQFFHARRLDTLLLGRRKADGNYTGPGGVYRNRRGVTYYSPMADWSHEDILACIHYLNLPLAPFYSWKNGFVCSTHPWPARQYTDNGWEDIYEIDRSIVVKAAEYLESAECFLAKKEFEKK